MCSSYEEGGLNMINIAVMHESFVAAWVTKLIRPGYEKWKALPQYLFLYPGKYLAQETGHEAAKTAMDTSKNCTKETRL